MTDEAIERYRRNYEQRGKEKGVAQGHVDAIHQIAALMLNSGIDTMTVSEITQLSESEINGIDASEYDWFADWLAFTWDRECKRVEYHSLETGIAQGRALGLRQAAFEMKRRGVDLTTICECTRLSESEIAVLENPGAREVVRKIKAAIDYANDYHEEKGKEEGLPIGRREARVTAAQRMKRHGISKGVIVRVTNLSPEELDSL